MIASVEKSLKINEEKKKSVETSVNIAKNEIELTFRKFKRSLDLRERSLISQIDDCHQQKLEELLTQKALLENLKQMLQKTVKSLETSILEENQVETITHNKQLLLRIEEAKKKREVADNLKIESIDFNSLRENKIDRVISTFGSVSMSDIDASLCKITGNNISVGVVNQKSTFTLTTYSANERPIGKGGNSLVVKIKGPSKVKVLFILFYFILFYFILLILHDFIFKNYPNQKKATVEDQNNGTYQVSYTPTKDGIYSVRVFLEGKNIKGSPFQVFISNPSPVSQHQHQHQQEKQEKQQEQQSHQQDHPPSSSSSTSLFRSLTATSPFTRDRSSTISIDKSSTSTSTFELSGKKLLPSQIPNYTELKKHKFVFSGKGANPGFFSYPAAIAVTSKSQIIVSDRYNHRIQIFDEKGNFLSTFGKKGTGSGDFKEPWGLTVDANDNILVTDRYNHRIQIFSLEGNLLKKFGSMGSEDGQFYEPTDIALDSKNNIIVVENGNHRVQVFNKSCRFSHKFGTKGSENGQFLNPFSVAVNSKDEILVSDINNHRIQIFSSDGKFLSSFGSRGSVLGQLLFASFITVDNDDNVLVADCNNKRIQVFTPKGEFLAKLALTDPSGICINFDGSVLACDFGENQIRVF